jgi:hypothetical protein
MSWLEGENPRMEIDGTDLHRTMQLLGLIEEPTIQEETKQILRLLGDYPYSEVETLSRIERGATLKQLVYLSNLAGLSVEDTGRLYMALDLGGGLSSQQAHFLIERLKSQKVRDCEAV